MARLEGATVKALALELFDYQLGDEGAAAVAHIVGAMGNYSRRLHGLGFAGVQPPFSYPAMIAEANRIRRQS